MTFSEIYQPSALMFSLFIIAIFSIIWTNLYFRPSNSQLVIRES